MKPTRMITRLVVATLMVAQYVVGVPFGRNLLPDVAAQPRAGRQKLSSVLRDSLDDREPQERVRLIVQSAGAMTGILSAVKDLGGVVRRDYANLNHIAVDVPAAAVGQLAARSDVNFVSEDRPIQVTGHLETTTGAELARTYGADSSTIDGAGIGIAVIDSRNLHQPSHVQRGTRSRER